MRAAMTAKGFAPEKIDQAAATFAAERPRRSSGSASSKSSTHWHERRQGAAHRIPR